MSRVNTSTPLVSFVVPAFNAAATIAGTLESLLAQTRGDWEAVVVDDGSSDDTASVAERISAADARVRVVRQKNGGVSCARNTAIKAAQGRYLAFLDADDAVEPSFVEKLGELTAADPDVVALAYRALPRGNTFGYGSFDGGAAEFLIRALSSKYATFPCWLFAVSRKLVSEQRIEFVEGRRTGEDQEFILKALCSASSCCSASADDIFYVYQTGSETSAMGRNLEGQFDYPRAMLEVLDYFKVRRCCLDANRAEWIEGLLIDRFVGACAYAAEMALANGASDKDALAWIGDVLEESDCRSELSNSYLRKENRRFLAYWFKCKNLLPCAIRARMRFLSMGRFVKDGLFRR